MSSILTFENVSKNYGKLNALSNIQFEIPENSIFAILGPNGSGKSTLIRILAGLITSWNGNIFYKDNSIHNDKNYLKNFGFIVEDPSFYQYLSAIKNLQIFCRLTNTPFSRINEVLEEEEAYAADELVELSECILSELAAIGFATYLLQSKQKEVYNDYLIQLFSSRNNAYNAGPLYRWSANMIKDAKDDISKKIHSLFWEE